MPEETSIVAQGDLNVGGFNQDDYASPDAFGSQSMGRSSTTHGVQHRSATCSFEMSTGDPLSPSASLAQCSPPLLGSSYTSGEPYDHGHTVSHEMGVLHSEVVPAFPPHYLLSSLPSEIPPFAVPKWEALSSVRPVRFHLKRFRPPSTTFTVRRLISFTPFCIDTASRVAWRVSCTLWTAMLL